MPQKVLLVDNNPSLGRLRCEVLKTHGFDAVCVLGFDQARRRFAPREYDLVLIDVELDPDKALGFCDELKVLSPGQMVALLSAHHVYVPPNNCPDEVIPKDEGPRRFVAAVKDLLEGESARAGA